MKTKNLKLPFMYRKSILCLLLAAISTFTYAQGYRVNRTNEKTKAKMKPSGLGKNILAFTPVHFLASSWMGGDGAGVVGVGFSYERIFDNEHLSVKLPVNFTLQNPGIFLTPVIKFYPKKQGIVKYAVGPEFLIAYVDDHIPYYLSYYPTPPYDTRRMFGFGINNSLNFTISKHFYIGMDAGLGILYYDSFKDTYGHNNMDVIDLNQTFHAGVSIGGRF